MDLNQWTIAQRNFTVTENDGDVDLGTDVIRHIISCSFVAMVQIMRLDRISRDEYLNIPYKIHNWKADPTQFFVDRQINPSLKMWPLPIIAQMLSYMTLWFVWMMLIFTPILCKVPFRFYPALAAGLAYYMSIKRAPDRMQMLKAIYEEEINRAMDEDRDRASFRVAPDLRNYRYV